MNAVAYFIATQKMNDLLQQSSHERLLSTLHPKPSLRARIAAALRRAGAGPIDLSGPTLPTLENYPYRG